MVRPEFKYPVSLGFPANTGENRCGGKKMGGISRFDNYNNFNYCRQYNLLIHPRILVLLGFCDLKNMGLQFCIL